jgi:hypothetical protein
MMGRTIVSRTGTTRVSSMQSTIGMAIAGQKRSGFELLIAEWAASVKLRIVSQC